MPDGYFASITVNLILSFQSLAVWLGYISPSLCYFLQGQMHIQEMKFNRFGYAITVDEEYQFSVALYTSILNGQI